MEYIRRNGQNLYEYIVSKFQHDQTIEADERSRNMFLSFLNPVESYVISIQSLLIWERPYVTTLVLVIMTCLFWLNAYFFKRVYSFLAVTALIAYVYRIWVNIIWPQIRVPPPEGEEEDTEGWTPVHPQVLSAPELSRYLDDGWNSIKDGIVWFCDLRSRNHGVFCFIVSCMFLSLCLLGHFVPGIVIVYSLVLGIMIGPGIILYVIPGSWYIQLKDTLFPAFRPELKQDSNSDVEEFVPNVDSIVLSQLSLQHEDSPGREDHDTVYSFEQAVAKELGMQDFTNEDEDISLYQGLENFPNVEEEEDSGDEVELPQPENNGIKIIPTHYKIDSSDSENELFSAGLTFTDVENTDSNSHDGQNNNKDNNKQSMADTSATDNLQQSSLSSDIDIDEYEIVSKSDLAS